MRRGGDEWTRDVVSVCLTVLGRDKSCSAADAGAGKDDGRSFLWVSIAVPALPE
jgi:hypothetical protein